MLLRASPDFTHWLKKRRYAFARFNPHCSKGFEEYFIYPGPWLHLQVCNGGIGIEV
jgi:hypothetical protein